VNSDQAERIGVQEETLKEIEEIQKIESMEKKIPELEEELKRTEQRLKTIEEYERQNCPYPTTKRTTGLPVAEWVLWCGMFAPNGRLEWYYCIPVWLHYRPFKDPKMRKWVAVASPFQEK
jgi:hypothetical protein